MRRPRPDLVCWSIEEETGKMFSFTMEGKLLNDDLTFEIHEHQFKD